MYEEYVWDDAPNFQDPATTQNVEPLIERMLDYGKPYYVPNEDAWYISRYCDIRDILRDRTTSSDRLGWFFKKLPKEKQAFIEPLYRVLSRWLINIDEPDHKPIRSSMQKAFTSSIVKSWEDWLDKASTDLIDRLVKGTEIEIVSQIALPIPILLICEMLGIPEEETDIAKDNYRDIVRFIDNSNDPQAAMAAIKSNAVLTDYFNTKLQNVDKMADVNLMKYLSNLSAEISEEDIAANSSLLLGAGHETTASLIAALVMMTYQDRELFDTLKHDPEKIDPLIEECLRLYPPVQRTSRIIQQDYEIEGVRIPAGSRCMLFWAAANRDPEKFENPHAVSLDRGRNPHFAFSSGIHYCVGANVARLEARVILKQLLEKAEDFRIDGSPLEWMENSTFRCLKRLVLTRD